MLTGWVGQGLDVQHDHLDAPFSQQLHDLPTNASGTARDDNNLSGPVILVIDPVVQHTVREVVADPSNKTKHQQCLEARVSLGVQYGPILTLLGVFGQQQQRQDELGVESRVADDL